MLEYKAILGVKIMYPIINSLETYDDPLGKPRTKYEIFGAELVPKIAIEGFVPDSSVFDPSVNPTMVRIREESASDSIFYTKIKNKCGISNFEDWMAAPQERIATNPAFYRYNSVARIYTNNGIYPLIFDEMLRIFEDFFAYDDKPVKDKIFISPELSKLIRTFGKIGFSLVRTTEKKTIVSKPDIEALWKGGANSLLKANTIALMLLLGVVTYLDNGEETPIIIDGKIRRLVPWHNTINDKRGKYYKGGFLETYSSQK